MKRKKKKITAMKNKDCHECRARALGLCSMQTDAMQKALPGMMNQQAPGLAVDRYMDIFSWET